MSDPKEKDRTPEDNKTSSVSEWLDLDYIQKSLCEGLQDQDIKIASFQVLPATLKGENYASVVYRCVATDDQGREYRTIIKCLPSNELRRAFCNAAQIFRKEIDMYTVIFPDFEDMLVEKGMGTFWPKYYYSSLDGSKDTIVLEDASPQGFVMRERRRGLNADHLEVAMAALAWYHACSAAMKIRDPGAFQRKVVALYPELLYTAENEVMDGMVHSCLDSGSGVIRDWGGEKYTRIADKILEWDSSVYGELIETLMPKEGALLTHGDFWVNNMIFRYATREEAETGSGKPVEVMLLDFQVARYCSPAVDLSYLMISSVDTETKKKHWKRLLEHAYLENFWNTLESLGHKGDIRDGLYTKEWLDSEMQAHRKFAFLSSITVLKAVMAPTEQAPDMESITEESFKAVGGPFAEVNKDVLFQDRYRGIIDELAEEGLFD